jgi:hypothetical protein
LRVPRPIICDMPVLVSVFNTRLKILERHLPDRTAEASRQAVTDIRAILSVLRQPELGKTCLRSTREVHYAGGR